MPQKRQTASAQQTMRAVRGSPRLQAVQPTDEWRATLARLPNPFGDPSVMDPAWKRMIGPLMRFFGAGNPEAMAMGVAGMATPLDKLSPGARALLLRQQGPLVRGTRDIAAPLENRAAIEGMVERRLKNTGPPPGMLDRRVAVGGVIPEPPAARRIYAGGDEQFAAKVSKARAMRAWAEKRKKR